MAHVVFFEKPGCLGNRRQKALLIASGHDVEARNLLAEPWTAETLRSYFGDKPPREWFNASSPRVRSGEIRPDELSAEAALAAMIEDPLLIRRPLMRVDNRCEFGFDQASIDGWIGLCATREPVTDKCVRAHGPAHQQTCRPPSA